jgi:hypothetical protein
MLAETISDPIPLPRVEEPWIPPVPVIITASSVWIAWVNASVVMGVAKPATDILDSLTPRLATNLVVATVIRALTSSMITLLSDAAMLWALPRGLVGCRSRLQYRVRASGNIACMSNATEAPFVIVCTYFVTSSCSDPANVNRAGCSTKDTPDEGSRVPDKHDLCRLGDRDG